MTDHIEYKNDDLDEEDEEDARAPLWESIANAIATLSEATDAPTGVRTASSSIRSDDVDMTSDSWMPQLAQVQDTQKKGLLFLIIQPTHHSRIRFLFYQFRDQTGIE